MLACSLLTLTLLAMPDRLDRYEDVVRHLRSGGEVRVVIAYKECRLEVDGKEEPAPDAVGGMALDAWELFARGVVRNPKEYVASSHTVLISHPSHGHVLNYVRLRLYEDGTVEVTARYLKPEGHEVVMDETFRGDLGKGVRMFGS